MNYSTLFYMPRSNLLLTPDNLLEYRLSERSSEETLEAAGIFRLQNQELPNINRFQFVQDLKPIEKVNEDGTISYLRNQVIGELYSQPIIDPTTGNVISVEQQKENYDKQQIEILKNKYLADVDELMDSKAKEYGYNTVVTAITYAEEPSVPKFQEEGKAFRQWRSVMYASCYQAMTDYYNGLLEINSFDDLKKHLPKFPLDPEDPIPAPPPPPPNIDHFPPVGPDFKVVNIFYPGFEGNNPEVLPEGLREYYVLQVMMERRRLWDLQNNPPEPTPEPVATAPAVEPAPPPTDAPTEPPPNTVDPQNINSTNP